MLDVNSIMAKTEAKCRGRVCLRKLSWTGYVCKHAVFRLTDQFSFQFLCCRRQTSFFKSIIISWPKIEKQRVRMTYDTCVWAGVTPTIEYSTILTIKTSLKMALVSDEICTYYAVFAKKPETNILLISKSNG